MPWIGQRRFYVSPGLDLWADNLLQDGSITIEERISKHELKIEVPDAFVEQLEMLHSDTANNLVLSFNLRQGQVLVRSDHDNAPFPCTLSGWPGVTEVQKIPIQNERCLFALVRALCALDRTIPEDLEPEPQPSRDRIEAYKAQKGESGAAD